MFILKSTSNTINQNEIDFENQIIKGDFYNAVHSRSGGNAKWFACFMPACLTQTLLLLLTIKQLFYFHLFLCLRCFFQFKVHMTGKISHFKNKKAFRSRVKWFFFIVMSLFVPEIFRFSYYANLVTDDVKIYQIAPILMLLWQHAGFQTPASPKLNVTICDSARQNTWCYLRRFCLFLPCAATNDKI